MEDNKLPETVQNLIEAALSFVDTDTAYGPTHPRTQTEKERLARVTEALTPTNVDIPELHVVRDAHGMPTLPVADPQRWNQVRARLTEGCELPSLWINALHADGKVYADLHGNPVFVGEDDHRAPSVGLFTMRMASEDPRVPPVLMIAERPVDAISVLEIHRRLYRDRADGKNERGAVTMIATEGVRGLPYRAIEDTLSRGGMVRVATNNNPAGELIWHQVRNNYPTQRVERMRPMHAELE